ncbi:MAG: primary-amine oxidase [Elainellaceae cyanobacterium]
MGSDRSTPLSLSTPTAAMHPLDPLSPQEIALAADCVRSHPDLSSSVRFVTISLEEPPKSVVLAVDAGESVEDACLERQALVIILDSGAGITYEAVVNLSQKSLMSWRSLPHVQPAILSEEIEACEALIKADPEFRAALERRGITQFDWVMVDPWAVGNYGLPEEDGVRLVRALCWLRSGAHSNGYAKPIDGLTPIVDLNRMAIVQIEDTGVVPLPPDQGEYAAEFSSQFRSDLKPLQITQPDGPSFTVEGQRVEWQNWSFRVGFTPREGLVLHTVSYTDQGRQRSVLYRASLSEMVVPYGDPRPQHFRKNAFDVGEYGVGVLANSLKLGCDCLGEIYYFDAYVNDIKGNAAVIENAICLHEEDDGVLWKHYDWRIDQTEVRRSRKLVISFITTIENYEYGFYWNFYQDGSLRFEVKLTGILLCGALANQPAHGTLVAPELNALYHQHFFNMRLDFALDGINNSVSEVNTAAVAPGAENPWGNAFVTQETVFSRESEAQRTTNPLSGRFWKICNPNVTNRLGRSPAYRLVPGENILPFAQPDSSIMQRAGFMNYHLWVTPYHPQERYAAGDYPNQRAEGDGLPEWTAADRPIENTDVVVWYTFCHHHIPRPEEWPIMPAARIDFALKPDGFFDGNPSLDVPPLGHQASLRSPDCH